MQEVAQVDRSPFFLLGKRVVQMRKNSDNCHQLDMSNCDISLTYVEFYEDRQDKRRYMLSVCLVTVFMKTFSSMILLSETSQNFFVNN